MDDIRVDALEKYDLNNPYDQKNKEKFFSKLYNRQPINPLKIEIEKQLYIRELQQKEQLTKYLMSKKKKQEAIIYDKM